MKIKIKLAVLLLMAAPSLSMAQANSEGGFVDFSLGYQIMCGVRADHSVACETGEIYKKYALPDNHPAFISVESGGSYSCGVTTNNGIYCWGDNDFGQLNAPNTVTNFESVAVGNGFHACGVTTDDQIICWGLDTNGQATPPNNGYGYTQVYVGYQSTCGLRQDGDIECWGGGDPEDPPRVFGYGPYKSFITEYGFGRRPDDCGLLQDGTFICENIPSPILLNQYQDIVIRYPYVCGLQNSGEIECIKEVNINSSNDELEEIEGRYTQFKVAGGGLCALSVEGAIRCFGNTIYDDLIPGSEREIETPLGVAISIYSDTALEVTWERIQGSGYSGVSGYEIYRNGEFLALVEGNSYYDDTLSPGFDYRYSVRAVSGLNSRSEFSEEIVINTGSRDEGLPPVGSDYVVPNRPSEPTEVDVFVYSANTIELIWNRPVNNEAIGYEIRRNNQYVGFTRGISYFDDTVSVDNCYRYNILPVHADGHLLGLLNAFVATGDVVGCE